MRRAVLVMAVMASLLAFLPATSWSAPCAGCEALSARVEKEKKGTHACGRKVPARVVTTRCADCAEGLEKGSGPCARCLEEHGKKAGKILGRLPLSSDDSGSGEGK